MEEEENISWDDEMVCPKCGRDWDKISDQWSRDEYCLCGEFLDNPPSLTKKEDFNYKGVTGNSSPE